jgi:hypothetical protein
MLEEGPKLNPVPYFPQLTQNSQHHNSNKITSAMKNGKNPPLGHVIPR